MKHLLVVDVELTEENKHICKDDNNRCPLWNEEINLCMYYFNNKTKGCPLKPMPQELPTPYMMRQIQIAEGIQTEKPPYTEEYQRGYNDCLGEILEETDG